LSGPSGPIFARVAGRYDLINAILSLGRERQWRASGVRRLPPGLILDLGCGTGAADFEGRHAVGLDPVVEMLALSPAARRVAGAGEELPFRDDSFDGAFSAFVLRNLASIDRTLDETARVLKPGAVLVVLGLSRPVNPALRLIHRVGTAIALPLTGLVAAGAPREYWYLHKSLDSLPPPEEMLEGRSLQLAATWRMGLFGFVYGATLVKTGPSTPTRGGEAADRDPAVEAR